MCARDISEYVNYGAIPFRFQTLSIVAISWATSYHFLLRHYYGLLSLDLNYSFGHTFCTRVWKEKEEERLGGGTWRARSALLLLPCKQPYQ